MIFHANGASGGKVFETRRPEGKSRAESSADGHRQLGVGPLPVIDGNLVVGNCVSAIRAVGLRTGGYR